jgi:hypothetical protein
MKHYMHALHCYELFIGSHVCIKFFNCPKDFSLLQ